MDYIEITGIVKYMTDKAVLFNDGIKDVWLPRSQLEDLEIKDKVATVTMPEWLAAEKELI